MRHFKGSVYLIYLILSLSNFTVDDKDTHKFLLAIRLFCIYYHCYLLEFYMTLFVTYDIPIFKKMKVQLWDEDFYINPMKFI